MRMLPSLRGVVVLIVALALPLGATEQPADATAETTRLQQQVNTLSEQLDLRFAANSAKRQLWRGVLAEALLAWNDSPRGPEELALMTAWLEGTLDQSLPGGSAKPPAAPKFAPPQVAEATPQFTRRTPPSDLAAKPKIRIRVETQSAPAPPEMVAQTSIQTPRISVPPQPEARLEAKKRPAIRPTPKQPAPAPPVAALRDEGNPFRDDPLPSPAPVASPTVARSEPLEASPVRELGFNVRELSIRLRGYNAAVQTIRGELLSEAEPTPAFYSGIVRETLDLRSRRMFLELYLSNLDRKVAATMPELQSVEVLAGDIRQSLEARLNSPVLENSPARQELLRLRAELDRTTATAQRE